MSPQYCPNCGKPVFPDHGDFCPYCGSRIATKKGPLKSGMWGTLFGIFAGIALLIFLIGKCTSPSSEVSSNWTPTPAPTRSPSSETRSSETGRQPANTGAQSTPTRHPTNTPKPATPTRKPTNTPKSPTPTRRPTSTPKRPFSIATASPEEQIRDFFVRYRKVREDALTRLRMGELDEIFSYPILERQRRGICGLRNAGQHYEYSNRRFDIERISFPDSRHASVVARIRENRKLIFNDGREHDYGYEDYRALYKLEKDATGKWKIYCFRVLDDNESIYTNSCNVEIPKENPCIQ